MMSKTEQDTRYNGWANYATWRVHLEIFDGYDPEGTPVEAEWCREYVEDLLTIDGSNANALAVDYARAFLSDVDWREIARHVNEAYGLTDGEG